VKEVLEMCYNTVNLKVEKEESIGAPFPRLTHSVARSTFDSTQVGRNGKK